jgi:hypothetical protein
MTPSLLPAALPAVATARLPENYEAARQALAECESVDDCKGWAEKAAALASYARQADDPTLENHARRIRARATRRMGELLREVDGRRAKSGSPPTFLRREVAAEAGVSRHQQGTAVRIAAIPDDAFEELVERSPAPGTTLLAKVGQQTRSPPTERPTLTSEDFSEILRRIHTRDVVAHLRGLSYHAERINAAVVADTLVSNEVPTDQLAAGIRFVERLRGELERRGLLPSHLKPVRGGRPPACR